MIKSWKTVYAWPGLSWLYADEYDKVLDQWRGDYITIRIPEGIDEDKISEVVMGDYEIFGEWDEDSN